MRASDLLRDLIGPGTPANPANPANSRASTTFAGLRMAANACESAGDSCEISQDSQAFATAESKQPCGPSQDSQLSHALTDEKVAPLGEESCPTCGCGSFWRGDSWHCEQCTPPGNARVAAWRNIGGGKVPQARRPAEAWPADLDRPLRRVSCAYEWLPQDRTDFIAWARSSPEGQADARQFLIAEAARLPAPGLSDRRRKVRDMLAADPGLRYAYTCTDTGADPVVLVLAIRGAGTCELGIPRAKFDALALPQLIARLAGGDAPQ